MSTIETRTIKTPTGFTVTMTWNNYGGISIDVNDKTVFSNWEHVETSKKLVEIDVTDILNKVIKVAEIGDQLKEAVSDLSEAQITLK